MSDPILEGLLKGVLLVTGYRDAPRPLNLSRFPLVKPRGDFAAAFGPSPATNIGGGAKSSSKVVRGNKGEAAWGLKVERLICI